MDREELLSVIDQTLRARCGVDKVHLFPKTEFGEAAEIEAVQSLPRSIHKYLTSLHQKPFNEVSLSNLEIEWSRLHLLVAIDAYAIDVNPDIPITTEEIESAFNTLSEEDIVGVRNMITARLLAQSNHPELRFPGFQEDPPGSGSWRRIRTEHTPTRPIRASKPIRLFRQLLSGLREKRRKWR